MSTSRGARIEVVQRSGGVRNCERCCTNVDEHHTVRPCFRSDSDGRGGYAWSVTFLEYVGDVPLLVADSDLSGYSVTVSVVEVSVSGPRFLLCPGRLRGLHARRTPKAYVALNGGQL